MKEKINLKVVGEGKLERVTGVLLTGEFKSDTDQLKVKDTEKVRFNSNDNVTFTGSAEIDIPDNRLLSYSVDVWGDTFSKWTLTIERDRGKLLLDTLDEVIEENRIIDEAGSVVAVPK